MSFADTLTFKHQTEVTR